MVKPKTQPRKNAISAPYIPRTNVNLARINPLFLERMIIQEIEAGTRDTITYEEVERARMTKKAILKKQGGEEKVKTYIVVTYQSRESFDEVSYVFKILKDTGRIYTIGPPNNAERKAIMKQPKRGMRGHYFRPH